LLHTTYRYPLLRLTKNGTRLILAYILRNEVDVYNLETGHLESRFWPRTETSRIQYVSNDGDLLYFADYGKLEVRPVQKGVSTVYDVPGLEPIFWVRCFQKDRWLFLINRRTTVSYHRILDLTTRQVVQVIMDPHLNLLSNVFSNDSTLMACLEAGTLSTHFFAVEPCVARFALLMFVSAAEKPPTATPITKFLNRDGDTACLRRILTWLVWI
jgi:hypothetical protein